MYLVLQNTADGIKIVAATSDYRGVVRTVNERGNDCFAVRTELVDLADVAAEHCPECGKVTECHDYGIDSELADTRLLRCQECGTNFYPDEVAA